MASPAEHGLNVLGGILPDNRRRLEKALTSLSTEHFSEKSSALLFAFLQKYSDQTHGAVMPREFVDDLLRARGSVAGQQLQFEELYDACAEMEIDDATFSFSVQALREEAARKATGEALTRAMTILQEGLEVKPGEIEKGHVAARQAVQESFQVIDRTLQIQDAPEGAVRSELSNILADYAERKRERESGVAHGVDFGIVDLDRRVGGMQPGELVLAAGYSSDGKTTLCVQTAWSAAIEQGKNVVFFTTETLRDQVLRKLVARHSKMEQFGLPEGLNTRDLKMGTLNPEAEAQFATVARDLTKNPAYGELYLAQVPRSARLVELEMKLARIRQRFEVDIVMMDYIALLKPNIRRQSPREELAETMKDSKLFAVDNHVTLMSPHQVSREARKEAEQSGGYTSRALSETAEATNSSDIIVSMLAPKDNDIRYSDVTMQVLKNRDGETASGLIVNVDYATSFFRSTSLGMDNLAPASSLGGGGYDMLDLLTN